MTEFIADVQFVGLMAGIGPFERRPVIAVAVSGGGDSMALCLLAAVWARRRRGRMVALTVDHGLRPESATEAATVGRWMAARGIEHHVLVWRGEKPGSAIQAAARAARYDLLTGWCRRAGILHLMLAHHLEDQVETFLMRLGRGSGMDGLAAMPVISESAGVRLLRPLLGMPRDRLRATLARYGQPWLEDPSNRNEAFERVRVRRRLPAFADDGFTPARLGRVVREFGIHRQQREEDVVRLLARACTLFPAGYAVVDAAALAAASPDVAAAAVGRILGTVGGSAYPPAKAKVEALLPWFGGGAGAPSATLARCRCLRRNGETVVCRESRRLPAPSAVTAGTRIRWDERYLLVVKGPAAGDAAKPLPGLLLAPLGRDGWAEVVALAPELRRRVLPHPVALTLPALSDSEGVCEVPFLNFRRPTRVTHGAVLAKALFSPRNSLAGVGFCLAPEVSSTI